MRNCTAGIKRFAYEKRALDRRTSRADLTAARPVRQNETALRSILGLKPRDFNRILTARINAFFRQFGGPTSDLP